MPYSVTSAKDIVLNYSGSRLGKVANNGTSLPTPGDILAIAATPQYTDGHTAVVKSVNVSNNNGTVSVIQQNGTSNGLGTINVTNGILQSDVSSWLHDPKGGEVGNLTQLYNSGGAWGLSNIANGYKTRGTPFSLWGSSSLSVFAIDESGALNQYYTVLGSNNWTVWQVLPSSMGLAGGLSGTQVGSTLELFASDTAGSIIQIEKTSSGPWSSYNISGNSGSIVSGRPSVVWGSSSVDVFANSLMGGLEQYHVTLGSGGWTLYHVLPSSMGLKGGTSSIQNNTSTHVFSTDNSGNVIQMTATSGNWMAYNITTISGGTTKASDTPGLLWGSTTVDILTGTETGPLQQFHTVIGSGVWQNYTGLSASTNLRGGVDASRYGSTTNVFAVDVP